MVFFSDVTCRQLGYGTGLPLCCSSYGYRKSKDFSDNVRCVGNERRLTDCPHDPPFGNVCSMDYAAVACYNGSLPKGTECVVSLKLHGYTFRGSNFFPEIVDQAPRL